MKSCWPTREMARCADGLYARISASEAGERDQKDARMLYADLTDAAGKMAGDEYFARAQEFNRQLRSFPASLLRGLFQIAPLEESLQ